MRSKKLKRIRSSSVFRGNVVLVLSLCQFSITWAKKVELSQSKNSRKTSPILPKEAKVS